MAIGMSQPIILVANATVAKLINAPPEVKLLVSELLSYAVEGAEFMHAFASGTWSGRSSFFQTVKGTFPAGFFHMVHGELIRRGYTVHTKRSPLPSPLGPDSPVVDEFGNEDPRYDYQMRALRQVEKHGRGVIQVATGGGKSKICKLIVSRFRRMTMFLTTRGVLMYQMKDGFEDAGFRVGIVGDGEWSPTRGINVGMVQTLVSQLEPTDVPTEAKKIIERILKAEEKEVEALKAELVAKKTPVPAIHKQIDALIKRQEKNRTSEKEIERQATERAERATKVRARLIKLLELVEVVIGEEAHEAGGNSYYEILRHCKNAQIRVALTATPFMRQDAESNMRLMAAFGPVLIKVSEKMLIDRGVLARPIFKFAETPQHAKVKKSTGWQRAYKFGIVENGERNRIIFNETAKAVARGLPVMLLIQHKAHGALLQGMFSANGIASQFIQGADDQAARKKALGRLKDGTLNVLIGTTILDVGVDVPAVGMVILAGGGKAEIALRQRIGRGLRAKKRGPNIAFILDFQDGLNMHLKAHAATRRAIVDETPGFVENILPPAQDFPWHEFENLSKAA